MRFSFEIFISNLTHRKGDDGVNKEMNNLHDVLSIVCICMQVVDWEVHPKITCWIEARSLKA